MKASLQLRNKKVRVVLVGASVRAAAESAARAGFEVWGVDKFGDTDTRRVCRQFFQLDSATDSQDVPSRNFFDACRGSRLLRVGGSSGDRDLPEPLLAACNVDAMVDPETERRFRDPEFLSELVTDGVAVPESFPAAEGASPLRRSGRWIEKPCCGSGGLGIRWVDEGSRLEVPAIVQRWVPGRSFGASFLSDSNQTLLLGVCRSLYGRIGAFPFVYRGSAGPLVPRADVARRLTEVASAAVGRTGYRGLLNVDFLIDSQHRIWLLEINPRWSSSMELIERQMPRPLMSLWVDALDGDCIDRLESARSSDVPNRCYIKRVVFARKRLRFHAQNVIERFGKEVTIADIPRDGTVIEPGTPVLTLIAPIQRGSAKPLELYRNAAQLSGMLGPPDEGEPSSSFSTA